MSYESHDINVLYCQFRRSRNVSILDDQSNGDSVHKRLFTSYVRGQSFTDIDSDGVNIQRRDYILSFNRKKSFIFNCPFHKKLFLNPLSPNNGHLMCFNASTYDHL